MQLHINGEPVTYSLEHERTLAQVASGIRAWLDQAGFMISGFHADGRDLLSDNAASWAELPVTEVRVLDVQVTHTGSLRVEHWKTVGTWLSMLERELAVPRPNPTLAELVGSLDETLDGLKSNPFLPPGSPDADRFDRMFRGQSPQQLESWPAEHTAEALSLIGRMRSGLDSRLADAVQPDRALGRCAAQLREQAARLPEVSVLLQTGKDRDAMNAVVGFTDSVQALIDLLPFVPPNPERGRLVAELTPFLRELVSAFGTKDSVLIGDLLEYEITPRITRIVPLVESAS